MNDIYLAEAPAGRRIGSRLEQLLVACRPRAVGVATAFLSLGGARQYEALRRRARVRVSHVVAGLGGAITHPMAIQHLLDNGHGVRFGASDHGIFHAKLLIGGDAFLGAGGIANPSCGYIGSANFTGAGLNRNLESILVTTEAGITAGLGQAFGRMWAQATPVTEARLSAYERVFANTQRKRSVGDLALLNVSEEADDVAHPIAIRPALSAAVWVGLQSFTGEHTFQVEFPRRAGEALSALLGTDAGTVSIECADGQSRAMVFRYYADNSMYRLNVPNDTPLVPWARANHRGALLIWRDEERAGVLHASIVRGSQLQDCVARSKALGTHGETATREYGWY